MEDVAGMVGNPGAIVVVNVEQQARKVVNDMRMSRTSALKGVTLVQIQRQDPVRFHAITVLLIHVVNVAVTLLVITGIAVKKVIFNSEIIMVLSLKNLNECCML